MANQPESHGSKQRILDFLLANIGRVIRGDEIRAASGDVNEWARRLRELRNEEGYQIRSHRDRNDLKPGQYLRETDKRLPTFARDISKETQAFVLERNGYTCQMCGLAAGDTDPYDPARKVRLTMGHIIDKPKGGEDTPGNLRYLYQLQSAMRACRILPRRNPTESTCSHKSDAPLLTTS